MLPQGTISRLHRIAADEVWHFYGGGPLHVAEISPDGTSTQTVLGTDFSKGEKVQHVIRAGRWFGSFPSTGAEYSFVGCTVAPGFDFADFEMPSRAELLKLYPKAKDLIERLTD